MLFEFPARGEKPPVKLHWYDGGETPASLSEWPADKPIPDSGMAMIGGHHTLMTGARPDSPRLINEVLRQDFRQNRPAKTLRRIKGGPFQEWIDAIKGDRPVPGSNFDYSASLTEVSQVGVQAQRAGLDIDYDADTMEIINHDGLGDLIREPSRAGWTFGSEVWRST